MPIKSLRKALFLTGILAAFSNCSGPTGSSPLPSETSSTGAAVATSPESAIAPQGNREGNGGDHVRGMFILMGRAIIQYLTNDDRGRGLVQKHNLDLKELESTLSIERVKVRVEPFLIDNGGSHVDALGEKRTVTLSRPIWMDHFEKERDVYYLVFHDMLRSAGYKDDNYVISDKILPFSSVYRISTRLTGTESLIPSELMTGILQVKDIAMGGNGCEMNGRQTFVELDRETNVLEITPLEYAIGPNVDETELPLGLNRKTCNLSVPFTINPTRRLVVTQIDVLSSVGMLSQTEYTVSVEAFVAGGQGKRHSKVVKSYQNSPTIGRTLMRVSDNLRTPCGKSHLFRLNTSARLSGSDLFEPRARVAKIKVYFRTEACKNPEIHGPDDVFGNTEE